MAFLVQGTQLMQEFLWLDHLPEEKIEGGVQLANRLHWSITWAENEHGWFVWSGECLILRADSRQVAEAFLYGLGLAYSVLPDDIFTQLERNVEEQVGE
jgi:hypothetical protein